MRVAKIDNARNARRFTRTARDHHVVIIRVAINDALAKAGKFWRDVCFEQSQKSLRQHPPGQRLDVAQIIANPHGARSVPFQLTLRTWMREAGEPTAQLPQKAPKFF